MAEDNLNSGFVFWAEVLASAGSLVLIAAMDPFSGYSPQKLGLLGIWALLTLLWSCSELIRRFG